MDSASSSSTQPISGLATLSISPENDILRQSGLVPSPARKHRARALTIDVAAIRRHEEMVVCNEAKVAILMACADRIWESYAIGKMLLTPLESHFVVANMGYVERELLQDFSCSWSRVNADNSGQWMVTYRYHGNGVVNDYTRGHKQRINEEIESVITAAGKTMLAKLRELDENRRNATVFALTPIEADTFDVMLQSGNMPQLFPEFECSQRYKYQDVLEAGSCTLQSKVERYRTQHGITIESAVEMLWYDVRWRGDGRLSGNLCCCTVM
jgi:hypothetical protein